MVTNEELIQKAVITTDALASAGKLNPAQTEKFLDYVVDETVLKNNARIVRFRPESLEINKIGIGKRAALPKAEAADPGLRRGISTSKITLTPREVCVPFEISDNFKDINLEGDGVEDHIIRLMATQFGNDLEELYTMGDVLGKAALEADLKDGGSSSLYIKDAYLAMQDGWLRLADGSNIYDAAGANVGLKIFGGMLRQLPTKFRRDKRNLRFFMSSDLHQLYLEALSTRATGLGDAAAGGAGHMPFGVQIVPLPLLDLLPEVVKHVTLTGTTAASLGYAPVQDLIVTPDSLDKTPTAAYVETTDYVVDYANGTIARNGAGAIGSGQTVKVTFKANPQVLLTHQQNFVVGIGRDIRIEKDRNIFKGVDEYCITAKVAVQFEELSAIVKGQNIGSEV